MSLARSSDLILAACVGKHTDTLIEQLVINSEGKTPCKQLNIDGWGGYERVLPPEIEHCIGKDKTQCTPLTERNPMEWANGTLRQQTGRWLSLRRATQTATE